MFPVWGGWRNEKIKAKTNAWYMQPRTSVSVWSPRFNQPMARIDLEK